MLHIRWILLLVSLMIADAEKDKPKPLYHELSKKQLFGKDLHKDSLFGYSISYQHSKDIKSVIVGSPKADNRGRVFSCDIEAGTCGELIVEDGKLQRARGVVETHDFWLGANVKGEGNIAVVCAPRYVDKSKFRPDDLGTFSRCFVRDLNAAAINNLTHIPSVDNDDIKAYSLLVYPNDTDNTAQSVEKQMDSFGWSIEIDNKKRALVGGPAMSTGRVMLYKKLPESSKTSLLQPIKETKHRLVDFNFGYSITSGLFQFNSMMYAISSPYGTHGIGKVMLYGESEQSYISAMIENDDVGILFGAAMCAARVAKEQDALIVGAPAFVPPNQDNSYDVGAVYVYLYNEESGQQLKRRLTGLKDGGYFGAAIVSVGDLTSDGIDEIAIAAPYEDDGRGAVYLYSGADLLDEKISSSVPWIQRISGDAPAQYFGLSLSPLMDYDENGCKELAIGAPGNNSVTILRCFASIRIEVSADADFKSAAETLKTSEASSKVLVKLHVNYSDKPEEIESNILITVKLNHPSVKIRTDQLIAEHNYTVNLNEERKNDYSELITVHLPSEGDYDRPIELHVSASLVQNPLESPEFNPKLVLLDDKSKTEWSKSEIIAFGSKLNYTVTKSFSDSYMIGSSGREGIIIKVGNTGNIAYHASVRVRLSGVEVYDKSNTCQKPDKDGVMSCAPKEPIRRNENWTVVITLNMESLTTINKTITIEVSLLNDGNKVPDVEDYIKTITLTHDANFRSISANTTFTLGTDDFIESGKRSIQHNYAVLNVGVSTWKNIQCEVSLPPHTQSSVTVDDKECTKSTSDENKAVCMIDRLPKNIRAHINILIDILPSSPLIDQIVNGKTNFSSQIKVFYGKETLSDSITTSIKLLTVTVPTWIIAVAALVALLALVLLAWGLHECGCLRRKNKEELQKLKQEVKRQTIRRSMHLRQSMIEVIANQQDAARERLVGVPEENESAMSNIDFRQELENKILKKTKSTETLNSKTSTDVSTKGLLK